MSLQPNNDASSGLTIKAADQKHCFSCGLILHFSASQCPKCGAQQPVTLANHSIASFSPVAQSQTTLSGHQVFCRGCGSVIHQDASACPKCGAPQKASVSNSVSGKNRTTAAILAFLLGGIGGHKFYLARVGSGFLYLIFCWTFIPGIIALIEGIYYLTMSDQDFARKFPY